MKKTKIVVKIEKGDLVVMITKSSVSITGTTDTVKVIAAGNRKVVINGATPLKKDRVV